MIKRLQTSLSRHTHHIANFASYIGTRVIALLLFSITVPFFIRHTSDAQYGIVAIGFSLLGLGTIFDVVVGYVVVQSVGRRIARTREIESKKINSLFSLYVYFTLLLVVCAVTVVAFLPFDSNSKLYFLSLLLLLPAMTISVVVAAIFQARNELYYINLSRFGFEIGKAAALVVSALYISSYAYVGPILLFVVSLRALVDFLLLKHKAGIGLKFVAPAQALYYKRLIMQGLPSLFIAGLTLLITVSDKILIATFVSKEAAAHYSIAFDLNAKAYLLVYAANMTMYTLILRKSVKKTSVQKPIIFSLISVILVAIFYYLPVFLFSKQVITFLISPKFAEQASFMTSVMSIASVLYLLGNVYENALLAIGAAKRVAVIYFVAVLLYFCSLPIFAINFGVSGFIYAYLWLCFLLCSCFIYTFSVLYKLQHSPKINGVPKTCG